jgi:predicted cupin superfamily sugar epimerase
MLDAARTFLGAIDAHVAPARLKAYGITRPKSVLAEIASGDKFFASRAALDELVQRYALKPHPEGGFFAETYRAPLVLAAPAGPRAASTAIYFLLTAGTTSRLHRIKSDEVWHFYLGGTLAVVELAPGGAAKETLLGADLARGEVVQHVVPAGTWFGAYMKRGEFAFVGSTVAPGFDFADFELATRAGLETGWPQQRALIAKLT